MIFKLSPIFFALSLAGCAFVPAKPEKLYAGELKPESEIAALAYLWPAKNAGGIIITKSVDDKDIDGYRHITAIQLMPGSHKINIHYEKYEFMNITGGVITGRRTTADENLEANLKAGHKYVIQGYVKDASIAFRVSDLGEKYPIECLNSLRWDRRRDTREMFAHCAP